MIKRNIKKIKNFLRKVLLIHGTSRGIALGFALGLFLSILPTFGLGMIVALALAPLLRTNLVSTYLGTLVVNPFTAVFFYSLDYLVGRLILGGPVTAEIPANLSELSHLAGSIAWSLYLGGAVVAIVLSLTVYGLLYWGIRRYRERNPGCD